ncbi:MAG: hypothetical protein CME82_06230 [Halomonas sp.]|nr:hypothetical protein [Halomonas sp.]
MSEAKQESRMKLSVDPATLIPKYRERVAQVIEEWAAKGDPVPASELYALTHKIRNLRGKDEVEASEPDGPQPGGLTPDDVVARRCVAKLLKEWRDKLARAKDLEAEAKRLRHEADREIDEIMPLVDRYSSAP